MYDRKIFNDMKEVNLKRHRYNYSKTVDDIPLNQPDATTEATRNTQVRVTYLRT